MPVLLTLTANLLWEKTAEYPGWHPGGTFRATRTEFQVGGKGVNVSRMLTRLGADTLSLIFPGAQTGDACVAWLRNREIPLHTFPVVAPTREGLVVRAPGQKETTFLGPDPRPEESAWKACADFLHARPAGDGLLICGSIPGWGDPALQPFRAALREWCAKGHLVIDTYGPALDWLSNLPADLVKINRTELDLPGLDPVGQDVPECLEGLIGSRPASNWIITDGDRPVWWCGPRGRPREFAFPPVECVSATGCGDVLLAGLAHAHFNLGNDWDKALEYALPLAAANAASPGIAEFPIPGAARRE